MSVTTIPLTITMPENHEGHAIIDVIDSYASVHATYVERASIYNLPDTWRNACGFYILFSPAKEDGSYSVYVGKSDKDFTRRMRSHDEKKDHWVTALLVQRKSVEGLSSTQSSYLEGALRDVFDRASHVTCHNIARTGDWTLPEHEKIIMKQVVDSTLRIMLLRGYRTNILKRNSISTQVTPPAVPNVPAPPVMSSIPPVTPPKMTMAVPTLTATRTKPVAPEQPKTPVLTSSPTVTAPTTPAPEPEPEKAPEQKQSLFAAIFGKPKPAPKEPSPPEEVFKALVEWRHEQSKELHQKYRYILEDYTLRALSEKMPKTYDDLLQIPGIKEKKREQFGKSLLQVLDKHR